jgi:hypothetical protein
MIKNTKLLNIIINHKNLKEQIKNYKLLIVKHLNRFIFYDKHKDIDKIGMI